VVGISRTYQHVYAAANNSVSVPLAQAASGSLPTTKSMSASATIYPKGPPVEFKLISAEKNTGSFELPPTQQGKVVNWKLSSPQPVHPGVHLEASVKYLVEGYGTIMFHMVFPVAGLASCDYSVEPLPGGARLDPSCSLDQQDSLAGTAKVSFSVEAWPPNANKLFVALNVDNTKGGTKNPSDFTIHVSGNSPSPSSFPGSSSGTTVRLNAGTYNVAADIDYDKTGYTTKYSSGCSGTISVGTLCSVSAKYTRPDVTLHVTNNIPVKCPNIQVPTCPDDKNTGMLTTITLPTWSGGKLTREFPVGECCGETGSLNEMVPVGENYKITGKIGVGQDAVGCEKTPPPPLKPGPPKPPIKWACWTFDKINIVLPQQPTPVCETTKWSYSCEAKMGESGANVQVNYHWERHTSPSPLHP